MTASRPLIVYLLSGCMLLMAFSAWIGFSIGQESPSLKCGLASKHSWSEDWSALEALASDSDRCAQYYLAQKLIRNHYREGPNEEALNEAYRLFKNASEAGLVRAQYRFGDLLYKEAFPWSNEDGIRWLNIAARSGSLGAQRRLVLYSADQCAVDGNCDAREIETWLDVICTRNLGIGRVTYDEVKRMLERMYDLHVHSCESA